MNPYDWTRRVKALYELGLHRYEAGHRDPGTLFDATERQDLEKIGAAPMEFYDYAEDAASLDWDTALLIIATRRDYFLVVQHGVPADRRLSMADFPPRDAELGGIRWLPRVIQKAQARLRGQLPDDLMFCCGGDRHFFKEHGLHPADFLRWIWATDGDAERVLAYVNGSR